MNDDLSLQERLGNIIAGFVGESQYEFLLKNLFDESPGRWIDFIALCNGSGKLEQQLTEVSSEIEEHLIVTWLDYSGSDYGTGFCTIIFFSEAIMWSSIAIYNYGRLSKMDQWQQR